MNVNKNKESFIKGALILGIAGIIVKILGAFFRIPLGNFIGAEGIGYYQAVYPVYTLFLTLATAGFPTALAKLVSEKVAVGNYVGANKIFKVSFIVLSLGGIISFSIFFFGSKIIVNDILKNPNAYYAMIAISPSLLFVPVMSSFRGYFQGRREMGYIAVSQISEQFFRVIVGIVIAFILMEKYGPRMGAAGAIFGATIGSVISIMYLTITYLSKMKKLKKEMKSSKQFKKEKNTKILKNLLVVAVPITIGASVMPLINILDSIIVIRRLEDAGYSYMQANALFGQLTGMAMSIVNLPSIITLSMSMSLVPAISQYYTVRDLNGVKKEIQSAVKIALYIILPAACGLLTLSAPIMKLLYPEQPASVGMLLLVLSPCVVFLGLMQIFNGILQGMGKPMIPVIALITGMACKVIISYILTANPEINVFGSALGTVMAYFVASMIELRYIKKKNNLKLSIKEYIIKPFAVVIIMSFVVKITYNITSNIISNSLATVLSIVIGGIIYLILIFKFGAINKDDILKISRGKKIYKILKKIKLIK